MMKKTEQNIQKMSDNQYHMEQRIITMLNKMEETQLKIIEFARNIVCGKVMDSLEDIQFYLNYRVEIEETLRKWAED